MSTDARIGSQVGQYRIESQIGRGGMSVVYLAEDLRLGRKVALKLIAPELGEDDRFRERFVRESRIAAGIDHPNIIPIYEAGEADGVLFIAMRYVRGTDLRQLLREQGRLEPKRTLEILRPVAEALDEAHAQGLVHRDVKPANILIASGRGLESSGHVYLSDFGLTKRALSGGSLTGTGQFVGTLDYAAPEQFEGKPLDARTDVYSLGCLLYECLVGDPPFARAQEAAVMYAHLTQPPPPVSDRRAGTSSAVDAVIATAMAKEPENRYQTATALAGAFAVALESGEWRLPSTRAEGKKIASEPDSATPPPAIEAPAEVPTGEKAKPPPKQPWWRTRAAMVGAAVLGVLVFVAIAFATREPSAPPARRDIITGSQVVRIDPATGDIKPVAGMAGPDRFRPFIPVVSGQNAVWVATGNGYLIHIDPVHGDSTRIGGLSRFGASSIAVSEGLEAAVWAAVETNSVVGLPGVINSIARIDPATNQIVARVKLERGCGGAVLASGEGGIWTLSSDPERSLSVICRIDPATNRIDPTRRFELDVFSTTFAVGEGGVWVNDVDKDVVRRLDPTTGKQAAPIAVPEGASTLAVGEGYVWAASNNANQVFQIDPKANVVSKVIPVGKSPIALAVAEGFVWVTNRGDHTVTRIEVATGDRSTIRLPDVPEGVAYANGALWVALHPST